MPLLWTHRTVAAPATAAWSILTDLERWPDWGPSVRGATLDGDGAFVAGGTGRVVPVVGPALPFELTAVVDGREWSWKVAGIPATAHRVEDLGDGSCRIGFGVPAPAAPYLLVCALALRRIDTLLTTG